MCVPVVPCCSTGQVVRWQVQLQEVGLLAPRQPAISGWVRVLKA